MAWEIITNQKYNQHYVGHAEECHYTFSLTPEQVPGTGWAAQTVINAHNESLLDQGSYLLELQVWEDTAPTWQTDYYVRVVATASPLWWNVIIAGVLVILIGITIAYTINQLYDITRYIGETAPGAISLLSLAALGAVAVAGIYLLTRRGKSG